MKVESCKIKIKPFYCQMEKGFYTDRLISNEIREAEKLKELV